MFFSNKARSDGLSVYCKVHDRAYRRDYIDAHKDKINMQAKERYHAPDQKTKKHLYYQEYRDQILQDRKEYAIANADQIRDYRRSPKVKERARIRARNRYHRPEIYQRIRAYRNRPDTKERERVQWQIYYHKPDIRERYLNRDRLRRRLPEVREQIRIRNQKHEQKRRLRPEWPEYRRARDHTRRARKNAVQGIHTPDQIQEQLKRQKYRCYYAACSFSKFPKVNGRYFYHVEHTFPLSRIAGTDIPGNDMGYIVLSCKDCNERKGKKFPWEFLEGGRLL